MTSLKTSIKTITYLSDIGCLEIHGASLIVINGIASKVTFVEKADPVKSPGFCDDLDLNNSRLVHTASYSMVISETKTGYTLSNFKHLADDESLGGMWFYQK